MFPHAALIITANWHNVSLGGQCDLAPPTLSSNITEVGRRQRREVGNRNTFVSGITALVTVSDQCQRFYCYDSGREKGDRKFDRKRVSWSSASE